MDSTHEVVDFISEALFYEKIANEKVVRTDCTPWNQIPQDEIIQVMKVEKRMSQYGQCWLVSGLMRDKTDIVFWGPRSLITYLYENNRKKRSFYVQAGGTGR